MGFLQHGDVGLGQRAAGLPEQRGHEQAAAHADPAVDPPHRQVDVEPGQRSPPGDDVLVHAVDEGPVEVEEERGRGWFVVVRQAGHGTSVPRAAREAGLRARAGQGA